MPSSEDTSFVRKEYEQSELNHQDAYWEIF